jgi:hypothetical protein
MKITRREWAGALAAGAAGIAGAQEKPDTPEELRKAAGERVRRNANTLTKYKVPMATEPAFSFKAQ